MIDLFELYSNIKDEKSAIHFFQQHNIIPNEKKCINEHWMTITVHRTNLFLWRCPVKNCRKTCSVRKGNWLEGSKISLKTIILFIYCWLRS